MRLVTDLWWLIIREFRIIWEFRSRRKRDALFGFFLIVGYEMEAWKQKEPLLRLSLFDLFVLKE